MRQTVGRGGRRGVDLNDLRPCDIEIEDIANALSNLCRFTGHVTRFLSVAEHCVLVSHLVPEPHAYHALLHDATEAFVGDMGRPIKDRADMLAYRQLEDRIGRVIAKRFGLTKSPPRMAARGRWLSCKEAIKEADELACRIEASVVQPWASWWYGPLPMDAAERVHCWPPEQARHEFMQRYKTLTLHEPGHAKLAAPAKVAG